MRVEELDETFAADVVTLWESAGLTRPWNDPLDDFARAVRGSTSSVLGALDEHALVGTAMVGVDGHRGWVYYVAVAASHQRRGIGRALLEHAEGWLAEHDAPKAQLMVRDTNAAAAGFYERLGYEDAHTRVLGKWLVAPQ
jgi:ribosomal protein S18 acetylase RimI-like enzyme